MRVCPQCCKEKKDTCFSTSMNGQRRNLCRACASKKGRLRRRLELFEAFGYKCQCCGETHPDFLTLEHIDGKNALRNGRKRITEQEIYHAKKHGFNPEFFSLLCMNCNFAKGHWGRCPHETGVTAEQAIAAMREKSKSIRYGQCVRGGHRGAYGPRRPLEPKPEQVIQ